jgi:hypothetical protein
MEGFSLLTFAAVLAGLIAHAMKHYVSAKRSQAELTLKAYYIDRWPESVISVVSAFVLWAGLPELATLFPDFSKQVGLSENPGVIASFVCGFIGNSLADFVGGRAKLIGGGQS